MLRLFFAFFIALHGLIHLMGFAKAFGLARFEQLSGEISRPRGALWLTAAALILLAVLFFLLNRSWWWIPGGLGAVLSQILIFMYWQDARVGTIPNLVLILAAVLSFASWNFERAVRIDLKTIWSPGLVAREPIGSPELQALPAPVKQWLGRTGVVGKIPAQRVELQQLGRMRTTPDGKWMPFTAEQWFRADEPAFLWSAAVGSGLSVHFKGKDRLVDGKGHMLIKLFGLLPIVDAGGPEIDQGSALRYLAETIWFPSAALEKFIRWEAIDERQARAIMTIGEDSVSGLFFFNEEGDVTGFEALRYYDREGTSSLELWHIDIDAQSFREFDGIRIPARSAVSWKLEEGDFRWLELEIVGLEIDSLP